MRSPFRIKRPIVRSNAWIAELKDEQPALTLTWDKPQSLHAVELFFDTDFDHAMETAQWGHPENIMPTCIRDFLIETAEGKVLAEVSGNHQTRHTVQLEAVETKQLLIKLQHPNPITPAAVFGLYIR